MMAANSKGTGADDMNGTTKARAIRDKYESEGWAMSLTYHASTGIYEFRFGHKHGRTIYGYNVLIRMSRGRVAWTDSVRPDGSWVEEFHNRRGHKSLWTLEEYVAMCLHAYGCAWPNSRAAENYLLTGERLVNA